MKEQLLKEFDEMFNNWQKGAICSKESIIKLIDKAISQTREETIRKVEEMLPDEFDITENEALTLLNKIKQSLNKLKK
ncbi:MAG: hypothetical protein WC945_09475 [Bacteroidales bacterium]